jgi:hypothetical protein
MRQSIGRAGSAILELFLPSARAQACNPSYCQNNSTGTRHRCCHFCPGIGTVCTSWLSGSCATHTCGN